MKIKKKSFHTEQSITTHFNQRISTYGASIQALQWQSHYNQQKRFSIIHDNLIKDGTTLLDLGCGCGDFYHYLRFYHSPLIYLGIDLSANMIVSAQRAYPKGNFRCSDIDSISKSHSFDIVIACGVFNLRLNNHLTYVKNQLDKMIQKAKKQIIFNVLSNKTNSFSRSKEFVYYTKDTIHSLIEHHKYNTTIIENYLPNDMTIIINKI